MRLLPLVGRTALRTAAFSYALASSNAPGCCSFRLSARLSLRIRAGLSARQLLIQRCRECRVWHHPPRSVCPRCWSRDVVAEPVSGRGTIELLTILRQGAPQPGVDYTDGHALVAIDLEEQAGLRQAGAIVETEAADIRIGAPVELVWREVDGRPPTPEFRVVSP